MKLPTFPLIFREGGLEMLESRYQSLLIKRLKALLPGCVILKNDTEYQQGIPDLLVLWGPHWAMLEVKPKADAVHEPNQDYFIQLFGEMSFGAFVYPENEEEVLHALSEAFGVGR